MPARGTHWSFTEMRGVGEIAAALELDQRNVGAFRSERALVDLMTAELLAESGRPVEALAVFGPNQL